MSRPKSHSKRPEPANRGGPAEGRLQKVLAAAGIGSRRECEELIVTGRVDVDGKTVTELGSRVDPLRQEIRVDGVTLPRPKRVYYALNKPAGVVCTNNDPSGRVRAVDLVRSDERLFTVGRLDRTSEGLILITNDGELANRLTHPRYEIDKRYLVRVSGSPDPSLFAKLRRGIHLAEGVARVSDIFQRKRGTRYSDLEISLREGRNREIRRILARVGHKVLRLKRIAIGPLRLGMLPVGATRPLTRDEVRLLQEAAAGARRRRRKGRDPESGRNEKPGARATNVDRVQPRTSVTEPARHSKRPPHLQRNFTKALDIEPRDATPVANTSPDLDELEIPAWEMDKPTGSVLSFDEGPMPASTANRPRKRNRKRHS